jgi:hypothetical protein
VRARLTVPCLDRVEFDGDRCNALVHLASAQLGGWMPRALTTSGGYARAFLKAARGEAEHLMAVADGTGKVGTALAANPRVDGTILDVRRTPHLTVELDDTNEPDLEVRGAVCQCVARLADNLKPEYAEALRRIEVDGVAVKDYAALGRHHQEQCRGARVPGA